VRVLDEDVGEADEVVEDGEKGIVVVVRGKPVPEEEALPRGRLVQTSFEESQWWVKGVK
jgi:hypothetical protein